MPEKPVSPFPCSACCSNRGAISELLRWSVSSLLACLACLNPGWGTISDKNQHLLAWATNCVILVDGQDEMGRCPWWAVPAVWSGRVLVIINADSKHWHWPASLSLCSDYGGSFLWAEELMPFWTYLQENPVNSCAWRENVISDTNSTLKWNQSILLRNRSLNYFWKCIWMRFRICQTALD